MAQAYGKRVEREPVVEQADAGSEPPGLLDCFIGAYVVFGTLRTDILYAMATGTASGNERLDVGVIDALVLVQTRRSREAFECPHIQRSSAF